MRVDGRRENVSDAIAFSKPSATPSRRHVVDAIDPIAAVGILECRVAKLMAAKSRMRRTENRVRARLDLDVADRLKSLSHRRDSGNDRHHRPSRAVKRS